MSPHVSTQARLALQDVRLICCVRSRYGAGGALRGLSLAASCWVELQADFGSSASRSPSPSRLKDSTSRKMLAPGQMAIQGALST